MAEVEEGNEGNVGMKLRSIWKLGRQKAKAVKVQGRRVKKKIKKMRGDVEVEMKIGTAEGKGGEVVGKAREKRS